MINLWTASIGLLAWTTPTKPTPANRISAKILKEINIKVTRIARGLPIGGDLEFADSATIGRAFIGRIEL